MIIRITSFVAYCFVVLTILSSCSPAGVDDVVPARLNLEGGVHHTFDNPNDSDDNLTYVWDVGDGSIYEGYTISHAYNQSGVFIVNVAKYKETGEFLSKEIYYIIEVSKLTRPRADRVTATDFAGDYDYLYARNKIELSFNLSEDLTSSIEELSLSIVTEDGSSYSTPDAVHRFTNSGFQSVTFSITDKNGISGVNDTSFFIGADTSTMRFVVPDAQLDEMGEVHERYLFVFDESVFAINGLRDMEQYQRSDGPLIKDGEVLVYSQGFSFYSNIWALEYYTLDGYSDGDTLSVSVPSSDWDAIFPEEYDDLHVILVSVGTNGKSISYQNFAVTPGGTYINNLPLEYFEY